MPAVDYLFILLCVATTWLANCMVEHVGETELAQMRKALSLIGPHSWVWTDCTGSTDGSNTKQPHLRTAFAILRHLNEAPSHLFCMTSFVPPHLTRTWTEGGVWVLTAELWLQGNHQCLPWAIHGNSKAGTCQVRTTQAKENWELFYLQKKKQKHVLASCENERYLKLFMTVVFV